MSEVLQIEISKSGKTWTSIKDNLYLLFTEMSLQMFQYKNLPKEIPDYMLEYSLLRFGQAVFFEKGGHYFCLPCVNQGGLSIYGEPYKVNAIAINGGMFVEGLITRPTDENGNIIKVNSVWIKNNIYNISTLGIMQPIINRLDYLWKTMGINTAMTRAQYILQCSQNAKSVVKREMDRLLDCENPFMLVQDKDFTDTMEKGILNTKVEYLCDKYWFDFDKLFTYLCTFLGINTNFSSQKKERVVIAEVEVNNELINYFKDSMKNFRLKAVDEINEMYGLNIELIVPDNPSDYYNKGEEEKDGEKIEENKEPLVKVKNEKIK